MSIQRTFQFSSDLFWGYRATIDVSQFSDMNDIITYCIDDLRKILTKHNLQILLEKLNQRTFHVHSHENNIHELIENTDSDTVIYICDHCIERETQF
jgi:hypothetical protein